MAVEREEGRLNESGLRALLSDRERNNRGAAPRPPPPPSSATAARLAPSSEPRLSSACQLVPWRRDGTVVALATRCFRPPSPPPLSPPVRETCAARGDIEWGSLGSDPSQLRPLLRE